MLLHRDAPAATAVERTPTLAASLANSAAALPPRGAIRASRRPFVAHVPDSWFVLAAMMKSFSCRPLIFFVCQETFAQPHPKPISG
jgi:hypothetical protein